MINSHFLGKTRTQVVKRLMFLFALALVALAYVVTPLTIVAARPGGGGRGGGHGGGARGGGRVGAVIRRGARRQQANQQQQRPRSVPKPAATTAAKPTVTITAATPAATTPAATTAAKPTNGGVNTLNISSTDLREIIVVLETGTLQFVDSAGDVVDFGMLRPGQVFEITASNMTDNTAQNVSAKLLGKTLAFIILPHNIPQQIFFANIQSPCLSSKAFPIDLGGSTTPQIGRCLDKHSASVTIPGSRIPATIVFPQSPKK